MKFIKRIVLECMLLCLLTGVLGVTANTLHPEGVVLTRNYFKIGGDKPIPPKQAEPPVIVAPNTSPQENPTVVDANETQMDPNVEPVSTQPTTPTPPIIPSDPEPEIDECVRQDEHGLTLACFDFVSGAWSAVDAGDSSVLFVDARTQENYNERHIKGALLLDHYRQDHFLPDLLPRLQAAQVIVIYCDGACEASRYLATSLIYEYQLRSDAVYIYEGGISEWIKKGQAVTKGEQP